MKNMNDGGDTWCLQGAAEQFFHHEDNHTQTGKQSAEAIPATLLQYQQYYHNINNIIRNIFTISLILSQYH